MRDIREIIVHCSATRPDMDIGVKTIREWHLARGFNDVGYHRVIRRDGTVEQGRKDQKAGAHAKGRNKHSIGVCLVGGIDAQGDADSNFTLQQWYALGIVLKQLRDRYGDIPVIGHRDIEGVSKACPCFDATAL